MFIDFLDILCELPSSPLPTFILDFCLFVCFKVFVYSFIYGCVGSSFLCEGFL